VLTETEAALLERPDLMAAITRSFTNRTEYQRRDRPTRW
jgi:hypothetical protein